MIPTSMFQSTPSRLAFTITASLAFLSVVLWWTAPASMLLCWLGLLTSLGAGLSARIVALNRTQRPELLQLLFDVSTDPPMFELLGLITEAVQLTSKRGDPIFRHLAIGKLSAVAKDLEMLSEGIVEFVSTESWRVVYEDLLRSPGLHLYRSVAHVESHHYWQDGPGQQSTQLNLDLQEQGVVQIKRTAIISDHVWPKCEDFPAEPVHRWLDRQFRHGIDVRLVRESELETERDLLCDFGIYGGRGVGMQTADPAGRTLSFRLDFNLERVVEAEDKWNRLNVYAISYADLLDPPQ